MTGVDMTVRVRRAGFKALMILAGAGLLSRSMSLASDGGAGGVAPSNPTLNLKVSRIESVAVPQTMVLEKGGIWAVAAPASLLASARDERGFRAGPVVPDGSRTLAVALSVGAHNPLVILTNAATVSGLLDALGVRIRNLDQVRPRGLVNLFQGERVRVIRVSRRVEVDRLPVGFPTFIRYSSELDRGAVRVISPGNPGQIVITYRVTYRNGKEVSRDLLSEHLVSQPVPQVEIHGTRPVAANVQYGQASWYNMCSGMHAAHLTLPKGTVVTVTNVDNGKTVTVVINDRGPYGVPGRIIDLCEPAFAKIAPLGQGVANVKLTW
jgi:Lytic transglycolase/G5 domain